MADTTAEERLKSKEREIPVFTVLKNNCILKNIYLLEGPPSLSPYSTPITDNVDQDSEMEETLVVGRHPDCSIKLEHPSISRYHLRISLKPSSRSLCITDLSSVHGTWVSGKRIEAGVSMKLNEGDTLQLGGSSRLYKLNWIPFSQAYDMDNPFVPQMDAMNTAEEDTEEETLQDENNFSCLNDRAQTRGDNIKGHELLHCDENPASFIQKKSPSGSFVAENLCNSLCNEEKVEIDEVYYEQNEISSVQPCQSNEEHDIPGILCPLVISQRQSKTQSGRENMNTPGMKPETRSGLSIWLRRGDPTGVHIETGQNMEKSSGRTDNSSCVKSLVRENHHSESVLKDTISGPDQEDKICTPDKNSHSPSSLVVGSWKSKGEKNRESFMKTFLSDVDQAEENFPQVTVNMTPNTRLLRSTNIPVTLEVKCPMSPPLFNVDPDDGISKTALSDVDQDGETFTPDKENMTPLAPLLRSMRKMEIMEIKRAMPSYRSSPLKKSVSRVDLDEESFTPNKDNVTPDASLLRSMKRIQISEAKHSMISPRSSPLNRSVNRNSCQEEGILSTSDLESQPPKVFSAQKSESFGSKIYATLKKEPFLPKFRRHRNPLQPLSLKSNCNDSGNSKPSEVVATMRGGRCTNYPKSNENNSTLEKKKRWTIIVETGSLLNENSRKELQLLRALKGTSLIIPRIVIRELDHMLRCGSYFRRTGKVSAALQWVKDCMENTKWWIHVQSSAEESMIIPPTPPPASSSHWFNENQNAVYSSSIPFSPYSSQEIAIPTNKDHILDCALFFKRIKNDEQLVLLSDDVSLKIKAMAEGVICETAEEFRRSLVNPFSERFLYTQSSPIGPTWSVMDDLILKEKYYPSPSKKPSKSGGGGKGLKLILVA